MYLMRNFFHVGIKPTRKVIVPRPRASIEQIPSPESNVNTDWWNNLNYPRKFPQVVNDIMSADFDGHTQILMSEYGEMKGTAGMRCLECMRSGGNEKKQTRYMCVQCSYKCPVLPKFYPTCQNRAYNNSCWQKHILGHDTE